VLLRRAQLPVLGLTRIRQEWSGGHIKPSGGIVAWRAVLVKGKRVVHYDLEQSQVRVAMEATGKDSLEPAMWLLEHQPSLEASVREGERTREPRSVNGNNDRGSPRRSP